ncbi:MAG: hypothetical protein K6A43_11230 [Treponema sp.]|nr:hypothetical protein [Treponema sp.]
MTKDDLFYLVSVKKNYEFSYNGKNYILTYDKIDGHDYILFGQLYETKKFESYGEFYNNAKVENHFFREMLDIMEL